MGKIWHSEAEVDSMQFDLFDSAAIEHSVSLASDVVAKEPVRQTFVSNINTSIPVRAIEDAGAELAYNRRNRVRTAKSWADLVGLNDTLKVKEATKDNFWPKPDYEQLISDGMLPLVAHIVKQVYDAIPSKPVTGRNAIADEAIQTYIKAVNRVETGVLAWANDNVAIEAWIAQNARSASVMMGQSISLASLEASDSLLTRIYPEGWKEYESEVRILGANKYYARLQPNYTEIKRALKAIDKGWPGKREAWEVQGMYVVSNPTISANKNPYSKDASYLLSINDKVVDYFVSQEAVDAAASLIKPFVLFGKRGMLSSFDSEEEAIAAAKGRAKRSKGDLIDVSGTIVTAAEREGVNHRLEGEDISSEQLMQTFGFKGVNFGNWMKTPSARAEAQLHLNYAYDSFMDLADILNVPPKAMSLGGMLGIAIGAQGGGGNAAAHFVPGLNELNISRTKGAGFLGHEFGHAVDHYFATMAGLDKSPSPYLSEHALLSDVSTRMVKVDGAWVKSSVPRFGELRPEIIDSYKQLVTTINKRQETLEEAQRKDERHTALVAKNIEGWLKSIRRDFTKSDEHHLFDDLAVKIRNLEYGDGMIAAGRNTVLSPIVVELRSLYKKEHGRIYSIDNCKALQSWMNSAKYDADRDANEVTHVPQMVSTNYASVARAMDNKKKGKPYWSTECEKFARAFDAFIGDTLEEKQSLNTYLSSSTWNHDTLPADEERKAINTAFKGLIGQIKVQETERGPVMFSLDDTQNAADNKRSLTVGEIEAEINKRKMVWTNMPQVIILETISQLPFEARTTTNGALQDGAIYLVAENLHSMEQLQKVLAHECVGHYALEEMLGDKFGRLCDLVQQKKKAGNKEICAIAADIQNRYKTDNKTLSAIEESKEIIARSVERCLDKHGGIKIEYGWIKGLYAHTAQWLRDKEFNVPFSNFELQGVIANAGAWMKENSLEHSSITHSLQPAFSLDDNNRCDRTSPDGLISRLPEPIKKFPVQLVGQEGNRRYVGAIVASADGYVAQNIGREIAVHHTANLKHVPVVGENVTIQYNAGQRGEVMQKQRSANAHTR